MPKMKMNDFDVEENPHNTKAKNNIIDGILKNHFLQYKKNDKDKTHPRPINNAMSLMSPNFEPNLVNCK